MCFVISQNTFYSGLSKKLFFTVSKTAHWHAMEALAFISSTAMEFFKAGKMGAQGENGSRLFVPWIDALQHHGAHAVERDLELSLQTPTL